jgi:hypothetical protein
MIVQRADLIIKAREANGQPVALPGGIKLEDATEQAHYPPAIWQQAKAEWAKVPPAEQQKQIDTVQAERTALLAALTGGMRREVSNQAFAGTFSLFDILWFFLAAGTA